MSTPPDQTSQPANARSAYQLPAEPSVSANDAPLAAGSPTRPLPPLIEANSVERVFRLGKHLVPALRGVSFTVQPNERLAILGKSGSGKSTLLNLLGGLDRPTAGQLYVAGHEFASLSSRALADVRAREIGFIFQSFHLSPRFTAWEKVALPLAFLGVSKSDRKRAATDMLARVGLADRFSHRPNELSGGEQQRVAVARALVAGPRLLLADEPTGNLDTTTSDTIMSLILEVAEQAGTTLIIVTHDLEVARRYTNRTLIMADGQIVEEHESAPITGRIQ